MPVTTNVPAIEFTPAGLVVPPEAIILEGVRQDYNDAFGGKLNPALNTPQGQITSSTAAIVADSNAVMAKFVNQVNPDTADGFMQDGIARIYLLERSPGAPTVVACQCIGDFGTPIPAGALVQDSSKNSYVCVDGGRIPVSGTITLNFANVIDGPIACPANTLTTIARAISGWDTINNADDGIPGHLVESRAEFEYRRINSVAANAHGSKESIYGAVFNVPDVLDVYVTENVDDVPIFVGSTNYELKRHSVYVAVVGGANQAIGEAISSKKDLGCNMNGNTTVVVTDNSYLTPPRPTYNIIFNRPDALPFFFRVELSSVGSLPSDIVDLVRASIIASFNGADGSQRARIAGQILASKFYSAVNRAVPGVSILSITIGLSAMGTNLNAYLVGVDQAPTLNTNDIEVVIT